VNCLAFTGTADTVPLLIIAAVLTLAGVGVLLVSRARRRKLRSPGVATLALLPIALAALMLTAVPAPAAQAATPSASHCAADPSGSGTSGSGANGSGPNGSDPGDGSTGGTPTPSDTPSPSDTPPPPPCTPTVQPDISFTFDDWTIQSTFVESPALAPSSLLPELVLLRGQPGWVPADSQTTVTVGAQTATAQSVNPNYDNGDGDGTLDKAGVLTLASTIGADNDFTLKYVTDFPYADGCGNTLSATVTYTGLYHVPPAIPQ
jgi:hypothetical protein